MAKWSKATVYGDYKDPLQNNKFNKELHFRDEDTHTVIIRTRLHELLHQCRVLGTRGKHVGSKPHRNLISPLKRLNKSRESFNKFVENLKQQEKVSDTDNK